jgi:hypothetical protein
MIARRHVIHVSGYDPVEPGRQHRRFRRELAIFARTWKLDAAASDAGATATGTSWSVKTAGPNWRVDTVYETLDWADIVRSDLDGPMLRRLRDAALAMADFIVRGPCFTSPPPAIATPCSSWRRSSNSFSSRRSPASSHHCRRLLPFGAVGKRDGARDGRALWRVLRWRPIHALIRRSAWIFARDHARPARRHRRKADRSRPAGR